MSRAGRSGLMAEGLRRDVEFSLDVDRGEPWFQKRVPRLELSLVTFVMAFRYIKPLQTACRESPSGDRQFGLGFSGCLLTKVMSSVWIGSHPRPFRDYLCRYLVFCG